MTLVATMGYSGKPDYLCIAYTLLHLTSNTRQCGSTLKTMYGRGGYRAISHKNIIKHIDISSNVFYVSASWAVVQLAGRRILAPLIKVRVLAAQPDVPIKNCPHRLVGPGQRPFTPSTAVQIRLGTPSKIKDLE